MRLQACLLLLKSIYDVNLTEKVEPIFALLAQSDLPRERIWPILESILRYMTGTKNRVPDEVINHALTTVFADQEEIMETIIDRWIEQGREEARQTYEKQIQLEREKAQQIEEKVLKNRRKTIVLILNHGLELSENDNAYITNRLAKIEDEAELEKLTNVALDATKKDIASFFTYLPPENKANTA